MITIQGLRTTRKVRSRLSPSYSPRPHHKLFAHRSDADAQDNRVVPELGTVDTAIRFHHADSDQSGPQNYLRTCVFRGLLRENQYCCSRWWGCRCSGSTPTSCWSCCSSCRHEHHEQTNYSVPVTLRSTLTNSAAYRPLRIARRRPTLCAWLVCATHAFTLRVTSAAARRR